MFMRRVLLLALLLVFPGCGTTQQRSGTEQLLLSDAVDRSIDRIDLSVLSGETVYLDATYIEPVKGTGYVNSSYIISALRQKLITAGCLLKSVPDEADYIVEARVGALGTDAVEVTYGIPASNALGAAASLISSTAALPSIPEISVGKRNGTMSTAKVVCFAYHRESGHPVWQSGTAVAKSDAKESWFFGAGPWQRGSIYEGTQFAGAKLSLFRRRRKETDRPNGIRIADAHRFADPDELEERLQMAEQKSDGADATDIVPVGHQQPSASDSSP